MAIESYSDIRLQIQEEIRDALAQYANKNQYTVSKIPAHIHNGVDSSQISYKDLLDRNKRVVTVTQSATPAINTDGTDVASITGLAQAVTSFTTNLTGTGIAGQTLIIEITDDGTARALTWGASFEASTVVLPVTTVISTKLAVGFRWNSATSKWTCVAVA